MKPAGFSPTARQDLLDAARWISQDNPAAARALRASVMKVAGHIGEYSRYGVSRPDLADPPYRFVVLTGFPYVMVYNADRQPPLIVRVLHGARDLPELLRDL